MGIRYDKFFVHKFWQNRLFECERQSPPLTLLPWLFLPGLMLVLEVSTLLSLSVLLVLLRSALRPNLGGTLRMLVD